MLIGYTADDARFDVDGAFVRPIPPLEGGPAPAPAEKKEEEPIDMSDWTPPAEGGPAVGTATPGEGKCVYTEDFLKAFEKGPQCQRQPADLEAPDDVDYWPLIGFTCPPGMQGGGGGGRSGRSRHRDCWLRAPP